MNNHSIDHIKGILITNPHVIIISGCLDASYVSDVYFIALDVDRKIEFGRNIDIKKVNTTTEQWIIETIKNIYSGLEIFKINENYYITEDYGDINIEENGAIDVTEIGVLEFY